LATLLFILRFSFAEPLERFGSGREQIKKKELPKR
jgi:hypothetical protein